MALNLPIDSLSRSEIADVTSGDHEFSFPVRKIICTSAGEIIIRLAEDKADLTLTVVAGFRESLVVKTVRQASVAKIIGFG